MASQFDRLINQVNLARALSCPLTRFKWNNFQPKGSQWKLFNVSWKTAFPSRVSAVRVARKRLRIDTGRAGQPRQQLVSRLHAGSRIAKLSALKNNAIFEDKSHQYKISVAVWTRHSVFLYVCGGGAFPSQWVYHFPSPFPVKLYRSTLNSKSKV